MFDKKRFRLKAIISPEIDKFECREINIGDSYADEVPNNWYAQYYNFIVKKNYIDFKPGDDGDENDLIVINEFELPHYFDFISENSNAKTFNISESHSIRNNHIQPRIIKSIIGITSYQNKNLILFQKFQDHIQLSGYRDMLSLDTDSLSFQRFEEPLLSLGSSIMAIYEIENEKLIFNRFTDVNYILSMHEYFAELSAPEIEEFVNDDLFESKKDALYEIIHKASPLLAKRFALVKESGILNKITAEDIYHVSLKYKDTKEFNVNVTLTPNRDKVIFPTKKSEAHDFLRLLNQDFYTGDFDGSTFLARQKRPV